MSQPAVAVEEIAREWASRLPRGDVIALAAALRKDDVALLELRALSALPTWQSALTTALAVHAHGDGAYLAGLLVARVETSDAQATVTPVWTGMDDIDVGHRLTVGAVADLIESATSEILLVSYATAPSPTVRAALAAAVARGVVLTALLERALDNAAFTGSPDPLAGIAATRLAWPTSNRPPGAAMHAKILVVDRQAALVGSANLTGHALGRNIECGLLIRGGSLPGRLADHVMRQACFVTW